MQRLNFTKDFGVTTYKHIQLFILTIHNLSKILNYTKSLDEFVMIVWSTNIFTNCDAKTGNFLHTEVTKFIRDTVYAMTSDRVICFDLSHTTTTNQGFYDGFRHKFTFRRKFKHKDPH